MRKSTVFIKNTLILSITALFMRVLGVYFNVYLSEKLGSEGLGLFTLTMSVYGFASTFATSAVNLTATRMVADAMGEGKYSDIRASMKQIFAYALFFSLTAMAILAIFSRQVAENVLGDIRTRRALVALALTLPLVSLSSSLGGYFTAVRRVSKNASLQVFQQILKVALTAVGLSFFTPKSVEESCLTVVVVSFVCEFTVFLFLVILYFRDVSFYYKKYREKESSGLAKKMLGIALPTAFTSYFRSALVTAEHLLITSGLRKNGMDRERAMSAYGVMQAKALPTVLFPYAFLAPFTSLIVPEIAEKRAAGDTLGIKRISETACRFVFAFGICAAGIVAAYSGDIGKFIYSDSEAGYYIKLLAPVMPVMFIDTVTDSILKGLDEQFYTMKVNLLDSLMSVAVVFFLVPKIGMLGYVTEIVFCEVINTFLSAIRLIKKVSPEIHPIKWIVLPLCASYTSIFASKSITALLGYGAVESKTLLVVNIFLVIFIYSAILRLFRCYTFKEISVFFAKKKIYA